MKKLYKLWAEVDEEGNMDISSNNDGFTAIELLGILQFKIEDIMEQIKGNIEPDTITRTVMKD